MARQPNSFGGGAQTNINGLTFERDMNLLTVIDALPNFHTVNNKIYLKNIFQLSSKMMASLKVL